MTVTGHVETQAVKGATWLLAEVERGRGNVMVFNTFAKRLQGDNTPTLLTFTFPVPLDATEIAVGLALRGDGSARAAQLRVSVGEPFDVNRPVPPEVETLLNAVGRHLALRSRRRWARGC